MALVLFLKDGVCIKIFLYIEIVICIPCDFGSSDSGSSSVSDAEGAGRSSSRHKHKKDKKKHKHRHKHKHKHDHHSSEKHHKHKHKHKKHKRDRHLSVADTPTAEDNRVPRIYQQEQPLEENALEDLEERKALLEAQLAASNPTDALEGGADDGVGTAMSLIAKGYQSDSEEEGEVDYVAPDIQQDPDTDQPPIPVEPPLEINSDSSDVEFIKVERGPKMFRKRSLSRDRSSKRKKTKDSPSKQNSRSRDQDRHRSRGSSPWKRGEKENRSPLRGEDHIWVPREDVRSYSGSRGQSPSQR